MVGSCRILTGQAYKLLGHSVSPLHYGANNDQVSSRHHTAAAITRHMSIHATSTATARRKRRSTRVGATCNARAMSSGVWSRVSRAVWLAVSRRQGGCRPTHRRWIGHRGARSLFFPCSGQFVPCSSQRPSCANRSGWEAPEWSSSLVVESLVQTICQTRTRKRKRRATTFTEPRFGRCCQPWLVSHRRPSAVADERPCRRGAEIRLPFGAEKSPSVSRDPRRQPEDGI